MPETPEIPETAETPGAPAAPAAPDAGHGAAQTLPCAHGGPPLRGRLREAPEDFAVDEQLGFEADGSGDHLWLSVRKRGANTDWVARQLARHYGVAPVDVGYAGLKDRDAVTTQVFTVHLPGRTDPQAPPPVIEGVEVLQTARHRRKLKRGALQGNRFRLRVRRIEGGHDAAERCLQRISDHGVPNYFGEQRFGSGGRNVERALAMFAGQRVDRQARSMLLSAARSQLFNQVLARRVREQSWNQGLDGEVWSLAGSRSWFGPEPWTGTLAARLAERDIHPSGPLWGRGELSTQACARALEIAALQDSRALCEGLERAGLEQDRRALRLLPRVLSWAWTDPETLELGFELPAGAYATVVLRELVDAQA